MATNTEIGSLCAKACPTTCDLIAIVDVAACPNATKQATIGSLPGACNGHSIIIKQSDECTSSDTTLSDDAELTLALDACTVYAFKMVLWVTSDSSPDFKWALTTPACSTGTRISAASINTLGPNATNTITTSYGAGFPDTAEKCIIWWGRVITTTAGNLTVQWAQNISNAAVTSVLAGSSLEVYK